MNTLERRTDRVRFRPHAPADPLLESVGIGNGWEDCVMERIITDADVSRWCQGPNPPKEISITLKDN